MLGIKKFRELIDREPTAYALLWSEDFSEERFYTGRILRKLAEGLSAREACRYSYNWEIEFMPAVFTDSPDFESFYTTSQIQNTVRFSIKRFVKKYEREV